MTKGISLPINAVIIVALASVVFLIIGTFFMTGTGPSMSKIQARQVFEDRCPKIKCEFNDKIAFDDDEFKKACKTLYDVTLDKDGRIVNPNQCLWYCECGLEVDTCKLNCNICNAGSNKEECMALLENKRPDCKC